MLSASPPVASSPAARDPAQQELAKQARLKEERLTAVLAHPHLPTPPAVALQVIEAASQADCDLELIVSLLRRDPSLCGRLLRTVNSSLFGRSRKVASLKHAVTVLGARPTRSIVLSMALPAMGIRNDDALTARYWQES